MEFKSHKGVIATASSLSTNPPINRFAGQSSLAIYINESLLSKLDHYTHVRSTFLTTILLFFLGSNWNYFLNVFVVLYFYLVGYRFIRFWIKRWLMFMIDFCYPVNYVLVYFLIFNNSSETWFYIIYPLCTGVLGLAIVVCDNQIDFGNTDFLTSCFIHWVPMTAMWAIRWKHYWYNSDILTGRSLITIGDVPFKLDGCWWRLIVYPYCFWAVWAIFYYIANNKIFRKYAFSDLYTSSISRFYKSEFLPCLFGDHKKYTVEKFMLQHFIYVNIVTPLWLLCFYSFYFNSFVIVMIVLYWGLNTGVKNRKWIADLITKAKEEKEIEKQIMLNKHEKNMKEGGKRKKSVGKRERKLRI